MHIIRNATAIATAHDFCAENGKTGTHTNAYIYRECVCAVLGTHEYGGGGHKFPRALTHTHVHAQHLGNE